MKFNKLPLRTRQTAQLAAQLPYIETILIEQRGDGSYHMSFPKSAVAQTITPADDQLLIFIEDE